MDLAREKMAIKKHRVYSLPKEETWKINFIRELALLKKGQLQINFDEKNLDDILEAICTD